MVAVQILRFLLVASCVLSVHSSWYCVDSCEVCSDCCNLKCGDRGSCLPNLPYQETACNVFGCNCDPCMETCESLALTEEHMHDGHQHHGRLLLQLRQNSSCVEHALFISASYAEKAEHLGKKYCVEGYTVSPEAARTFELEFAVDKENGISCEEFVSTVHPYGAEAHGAAIASLTASCIKKNCSSSSSEAGCGNTMYCSHNHDTCMPRKRQGEYCNVVQGCLQGLECVSSLCQPDCAN